MRPLRSGAKNRSNAVCARRASTLSFIRRTAATARALQICTTDRRECCPLAKRESGGTRAESKFSAAGRFVERKLLRRGFQNAVSWQIAARNRIRVGPRAEGGTAP